MAVREGKNQNIDDDTRRRAMEAVHARTSGGAQPEPGRPVSSPVRSAASTQARELPPRRNAAPTPASSRMASSSRPGGSDRVARPAPAPAPAGSGRSSRPGGADRSYNNRDTSPVTAGRNPMRNATPLSNEQRETNARNLAGSMATVATGLPGLTRAGMGAATRAAAPAAASALTRTPAQAAMARATSAANRNRQVQRALANRNSRKQTAREVERMEGEGGSSITPRGRPTRNNPPPRDRDEALMADEGNPNFKKGGSVRGAGRARQRKAKYI